MIELKKLRMYKKEQSIYIYPNNLVNCVTFEYFMAKKSLLECLADLPEIYLKYKSFFNSRKFTNDFFITAISKKWLEYGENSKVKTVFNGSNVEELVLDIFNLAKKSETFISTTKISALLSIDRKQVWRELDKLISIGILVLVKKGSYFEKKCSIFKLTELGINKLQSYSNKIEQKFTEKINSIKQFTKALIDESIDIVSGKSKQVSKLVETRSSSDSFDELFQHFNRQKQFFAVEKFSPVPILTEEEEREKHLNFCMQYGLPL